MLRSDNWLRKNEEVMSDSTSVAATAYCNVVFVAKKTFVLSSAQFRLTSVVPRPDLSV